MKKARLSHKIRHSLAAALACSAATFGCALTARAQDPAADKVDKELEKLFVDPKNRAGHIWNGQRVEMAQVFEMLDSMELEPVFQDQETTVQLRRGNRRLTCILSFSDDTNQVVVELLLADAARLQGKLKELLNVVSPQGQVKFCCTEKRKKAAFVLTIPAKDVTLKRLSDALDCLADSALNTARIWDAPPNVGNMPIVPPKVSLTGNWTAKKSQTEAFALALNQDGSFALVHVKNKVETKSSGKYELVGDQLTLLPDKGTKASATLTNVTAQTFEFQPQGIATKKVTFRKAS